MILGAMLMHLHSRTLRDSLVSFSSLSGEGGEISQIHNSSFQNSKEQKMDTPRVLMGPQEGQNTQYWYSTSVADQYGSTCSTTDQGVGEYINLDFMFQQSDQQSKLT